MRHCVLKRAGKPGLLMGLLSALVRTRCIRTTVARAKLVRPVFEKLLTKARKDQSLAGFRLLSSRLKSSKLARTLIDEVVPMVGDRPGGYTSIIKLGQPRRGDSAREAIISVINSEKVQIVGPKKTKTEEPKEAM